MKTCYSILTLIFSLFAHSQHPPCNNLQIISLLEDNSLQTFFRPCTYFKDVDNIFNKFLGTWQYTNGSQSFRITFYKTEHVRIPSQEKQWEDIIQSHYEYKVDGSVVFSNYGTEYSNVDSFMTLSTSKLRFSYYEPSFTSCRKTRRGELTLTHSIDGGGVPILIWENEILARGYTNYCPDGTETDVSGFIVPLNMVLHKLP